MFCLYYDFILLFWNDCLQTVPLSGHSKYVVGLSLLKLGPVHITYLDLCWESGIGTEFTAIISGFSCE